MKRVAYLLCVLALVSCGDKSVVQGDGSKPAHETEPDAAQVMTALWKTSLSSVDNARQNAFDKIQCYGDACSKSYFKDYLASSDNASQGMEKYDNILICYRAAFDRVLDGLKNEKVERGTAVVWMLYNMGYVVKTPSGAFAVDVYHRWGAELAPYLDFLCVSHNHTDHQWRPLMDAMIAAGKPVLSNFYPFSQYAYKSSAPTSYTIGDFKITTAIADHNSTLKNFVTVFRIDCGADTGNFTLYHTGDSNFRPEQLTNVQGAVDLLISRYAPNALAENRILGEGSGMVQPSCILLSHILELGHADVSDSRWTLNLALERASKLKCEKTYVPFWGEKMIWRNGKHN